MRFFSPLGVLKTSSQLANTIPEIIQLEVEIMTATKIWLHFELGHHSISMV